MHDHDGAGNLLLRLLDADARAELSPVTVQLRSRELLYEPGMPGLYAYFPVTAVISLVSTMESGASAEVALIGREGMVGLAGVLGTVESPTTAVVQLSGTALRTPTAVLRDARQRSSSVRTALDLYTEARLIQVAQTAACNRLHSVEARLARWLLAIDDRIDGEHFTLPQEFMAQMLGVHRPTVSSTLNRFQDAGLIAHRGRSIVVADRSGLQRIACECYGVLRREFDRLLRPAIGGPEGPPETTAARTANRERESLATLETMREIAGRLLLANIREQEAREEAEAANRAKDQFLAMLSHELRTPLNAILGWCTILTESHGQSPEHGLEVIRRNAQAQLKLVEDLLDTARLTSSTIKIQREIVSLRDLVEGAVDAVKPAAGEKRVALRLTIPDDLPAILADGNRIRQVLLNVLTNALKFTDTGGSVDIVATVADGATHVTVRDTGSGIASTVLPQVFDPFRQGSASASGQQGLGLGLNIARVIVELHGGTIRIASPGEGQGTTCTINLPVRSDAERSQPRAAVTEE